MSPNHGHTHSVAADIADLKARMLVVESGVANFKRFQEGANEFFTTYRVNKQNEDELDKKRAAIHFRLLSALIAVVGTLAGAVITSLLQGHHF